MPIHYTYHSNSTIQPKEITTFGERCFINTNARLYDPLLGRFLQPDNLVQQPEVLSNYNRYTYVLNNPLKYKDPSGELPVILIPIAIGVISGGYMGWQIGKAAGAEGWEMVGYITGGAVIGGAAGWAGASVAATGGFVLGSITSGAIGGTGFGALQGYGNGLRGSDLIEYSIRSGLSGAASGFVGSVMYGVIGGGIGALVGGSAANFTSQFLSTGDIKNINWISVGLSGVSSLGMYYLMSYLNYRMSVKNISFAGKNLSFKQYLMMQESYTRARFWNNEAKGGGFWLTKDGDISYTGIDNQGDKINQVSFDYTQKPKNTWATFHPHPFSLSEIQGYDQYGLGNSIYDVNIVNKTYIPSFVLHEYGLNFYTPSSNFNIDVNFWPQGRTDFIWVYFGK